MNENPYDSFKEGIKSDIKATGASLFLTGGFFFLVIILLTVLAFLINKEGIPPATRLMSIIGWLVLVISMIVSRKFLTFIVQAWFIVLVAIVVLPMIGLALYLFYSAFTTPLK